MTTIPSRIEEIKAREQNATKGPWTLEHAYRDPSRGYSCVNNPQDEGPVESCDGCPVIRREEDAQFIAHARADIPWLLEEHERMQKALQEIARHEIPFSYDYPEKWCNEFITIARAALYPPPL